MLHVANCYALLFGTSNGRDFDSLVALCDFVLFAFGLHIILISCSEIGHCVALLEDSVSILLGCLESTDSKMVSMAGYFAWNMEEALKCASFFRRIYEEVSDAYAFFLFEMIQISL